MKHHAIGASVCVLCFFTVLLVACGNGNTASVTAPSTAITPTPAHPSPTPTPVSTPVLSSHTYKGDGYTLNYPGNWKVENDSRAHTVIFSDSADDSFAIHIVPNSNATVQPASFVQTTLANMQKTAKNYKPEQVPPTVTINGVTWSEGSASRDVQVNGRSLSSRIVALATNHPQHSASTRLYSIVYAGPAQTFARTSTSVFQPMLQSFRFA